MAVEARFYISTITKFAAHGYADPKPAGTVTMNVVTRGTGNAQWASSTPTGKIEMTVNGPAFPWFEARLGKDVKITFDDRPLDEED